MSRLLANGMANFATSNADAGFLWYDASTNGKIKYHSKKIRND
jgi:hypothetical protein